MSHARRIRAALLAALLVAPVAGCATPTATAPAKHAPATAKSAPAAATGTAATSAAKTPAPAKTATKTAAAKPAPKAVPKDEAPWAKSGISDWSTPPKPGPEPKFTPPTPVTLELKNGIRVVVIERKDLPLVAMTLVVRGAGYAADPKGKAGLAAYTADLLDEGAGGFNALTLATTAERLGARLHTGVGPDSAWVTMSTLTKTLQLSMDLFGKVVTEPAFHYSDSKRIHKQRMTDLVQRRDRPRAVASLVLDQALYGRGAPYGHPREGYSKDLGKLGARDAARFYHRHYRPQDMVLVVAGQVDMARLRHDLAVTLGAWHARGRGERRRDPSAKAAATEHRLYIVDRPGAPQTELRAGLVAFKRTDPRYYTFRVLDTVLGDGFTSRLNQILREKLGYTYGAGSALSPRVSAGPFIIRTALFTPTTVDAVSHVLSIVGGIAKKPVPAAELAKAKENLIRGLPQLFSTNERVVHAFIQLVNYGLPLDWYTKYDARVRAVTAAEVQKLAASVIPSKKLVFSIVGDSAKIRPGLEKLLGPAKMLSPDGTAAKAAAAEKKTAGAGAGAGKKAHAKEQASAAHEKHGAGGK